LEGTVSAHVAELIALTEALKLAEGQRVNHYTDSKYAFGVVHDYMAAWSRRGYVTSGGGHIKHENIVRELVKAVSYAAAVAVMWIKAHHKGETKEQQGNRMADLAAREATEHAVPQLIQVAAMGPEELNIAKVQEEASVKEQSQWEQKRATKAADGVSRKGLQLIAPSSIQTELLKLYHEPDHPGCDGMLSRILRDWW